ncbi:hypothetical protein N9I25_07795 [Hellea sp.]|nr:hypothetical protein [Hellea sp.]
MRKSKHSVASSSDEDKDQVPEQGTTTKSRPKTKKTINVQSINP